MNLHLKLIPVKSQTSFFLFFTELSFIFGLDICVLNRVWMGVTVGRGQINRGWGQFNCGDQVICRIIASPACSDRFHVAGSIKHDPWGSPQHLRKVGGPEGRACHVLCSLGRPLRGVGHELSEGEVESKQQHSASQTLSTCWSVTTPCVPPAANGLLGNFLHFLFKDHWEMAEKRLNKVQANYRA